MLQELESCAEGILQLVIKQLQNCELDVKRFMGLATDGASVMVGKHNRVAAKLHSHNDRLNCQHPLCLSSSGPGLHI